MTRRRYNWHLRARALVWEQTLLLTSLVTLLHLTKTQFLGPQNVVCDTGVCNVIHYANIHARHFNEIVESMNSRVTLLKLKSVFTTCHLCCLFAKLCLILLPHHGLQPARLLCPWDFPGKNTGVGYHFLLQGIFPTQGLSPGLMHQQADSLPLSHQGSPPCAFLCLTFFIYEMKMVLLSPSKGCSVLKRSYL